MVTTKDTALVTNQISNDSNISNQEIITLIRNENSVNTKISKKELIISTEINNIEIKKQPDTQSIVFSNAYSNVPWFEIFDVKNQFFKKNLLNKDVYLTNKNDSQIMTIIFNSKRSSEYHNNNKFNLINDFILALLLISLFLLAWIKIFYNKNLNQIFRSVVNYSDATKLYRNHNIILDRLFILLNINFIISGGIFLYEIFTFFDQDQLKNYSYYFLLSCFFIVIMIFLTRYIINKLSGIILFQVQAFNEYLHSIYTIFKVSGILMLPIIFTIFLLTDNVRIVFLFFGVFIFFSLYIMSILRATKIMLQKGILLFYWILYLCTIEFLPIILLYKFLKTVY